MLQDEIDRLEPFHRELTHHATRMLGSRFDADDAVQETMVRAWRALDRFDGRSQLRSWLYRICTNVCLTMLASRHRRAPPVLEASPGEIATTAPSSISAGMPSEGDPADIAVARESVRLALVTVLEHLPPKQRAVLFLCEVLRWSAAETAELLHTSVPSVNSALQRARATLRRVDVARETTRTTDVDEATRWRLDSYAQALASSDVKALTALLAYEGLHKVMPSSASCTAGASRAAG